MRINATPKTSSCEFADFVSWTSCRHACSHTHPRVSGPVRACVLSVVEICLTSHGPLATVKSSQVKSSITVVTRAGRLPPVSFYRCGTVPSCTNRPVIFGAHPPVRLRNRQLGQPPSRLRRKAPLLSVCAITSFSSSGRLSNAVNGCS